MSSVSSRAGGTGTLRKIPGAALFQALEHQHAGGDVDPVGGQGEGLGEAASRISQRHAERPHRAVGEVGLPQEGIALAGGVQLHAGLRGRGGGLGAALPGAGF